MIRLPVPGLTFVVAFATGLASLPFAEAVAQSTGQSTGQSAGQSSPARPIAKVFSGEHADFTRLVIELPVGGGWDLGRTETGYAFASRSGLQPAYDLATVWNRIPRSRLQSLRVDPGSGALLINLACPCHVFPFEYREGMVVLDIRKGPAPAGSSFEAPFSPVSIVADLMPGPEMRVVSGYDWLGPQMPAAKEPPLQDLPLPFATGSLGLDPLRDELLLQISRGAADGVVEMELPGKPPLQGIEVGAGVEGARISLGELPGIAVLEGSDDPSDRQTNGTACLPDEVFSVADWGNGRPPLDLLAEARSGLFGEFDAPDPAAVLRAVKLHLYLGFGAEALQYADFLPDPAADKGLAPLLSMARLIEGDTDPSTPFASMLGCDGPAALWATLAHSRLPTSAEVNTDAIVRSFQALPPHLRRQLGAALADRLLNRDADAARMIRDAMERTAEVSTGAVALMDAKADLQADRPEAALVHAEAALAEGGSAAEGLIALVDAHFRASLPLSTEVAEALVSLYREAGPDTKSSDLHRALVLSLALSGQVDEAFGQADPKAPESADLWRVVVDRADDAAFLVHAVRPADAAIPVVAGDVALALADRLASLGFAEAALAWLGPTGPDDSAPRREVAARAELSRGDARRVLVLLAGLDGPGIVDLRTRAQTQLGALDAARQAMDDAGKVDEAARLATWEADWAGLQAGGSDPWSVAAAFATVPKPLALGPLARGEELLADSAAARAAVSALLADIPSPGP
jgi:hypothetical protein